LSHTCCVDFWAIQVQEGCPETGVQGRVSERVRRPKRRNREFVYSDKELRR